MQGHFCKTQTTATGTRHQQQNQKTNQSNKRKQIFSMNVWLKIVSKAHIKEGVTIPALMSAKVD